MDQIWEDLESRVGGEYDQNILYETLKELVKSLLNRKKCNKMKYL